MRSLIAALALLAASAAPCFAAPTAVPAADPGVGLWFDANTTVAHPSLTAANALLAQKEQVNGIHFRVVLTERGDDTSNPNPAFEIMRNRLWDGWVQRGHFDAPRSVVLLYIPDRSGGPGWLSVRAGYQLNRLGIVPDHLNDASGPIRPVKSEYFPDRAWDGLIKVIDNINAEVSAGHTLVFTSSGPVVEAPAPAYTQNYSTPRDYSSTAPVVSGSDDSSIFSSIWFWVAVVGGVIVLFVIFRPRRNVNAVGETLSVAAAPTHRPAPRPSSRVNVPVSRGSSRPSSGGLRYGSTTNNATVVPSCSAVTTSSPAASCSNPSCTGGSSCGGSSCGSST